MSDKKISREVAEEIYWEGRKINSLRLNYIAILSAAIDDEFRLACEKGAFEGSGLELAKEEVIKETVRSVLDLTNEQLAKSVGSIEAKVKEQEEEEEADLEEMREDVRARRWSQS